MSTSTGELREMLIDCIERVQSGRMDAASAKSVAMLAGQVTLSLQVEVNARREEVGLVGRSVGTLSLGDERDISAERQVDELPEETTTVVSPSTWPGRVIVHKMER